MATLKISELSVGDWVGYNGKSYRTVIVDALDQTATIFGNDEQGDIHIEQLAPIPITAEILEKNGFEKYSERKWGCYDDSPYHTFIHIDTPDETMWFISFPTIFDLAWDCPIYNIHELQHLIRLAGVDKKINL